MSYFALIKWDDESRSEGTVDNYIVASDDNINSGNFGPIENFIKDVDRTAGRGLRYESAIGKFYDSAPYPSWVLDRETFTWEPPVPMPPDGVVGWGFYEWNEQFQRWDEVEIPEGEGFDAPNDELK